MSMIVLDGLGDKAISSLSNVTKEMLSSFISKPKEQDITDWLASELEAKLADKEDVSFRDIAQNITDSIDRFNQNLQSVEEAGKHGISKEEWLRDSLKALAAEKGIEETGNYLTGVVESLAAGNEVVMSAVKAGNGTIVYDEEKLGNVELSESDSKQPMNSLLLSKVTNDLAQQAVLTGANSSVLASSSMEIVRELSPVNANDTYPMAEEAMDSSTGSDLDKGLKTVAAGALKIAVNNKWIPGFTKNTPISVISDTACWGIEGIKTAKKVFSGKISIRDAVEHMGRVSSTVIANLCVQGISKKVISSIPVVGPIVGNVIGSVISNKVSEKVSEMVYEGFKIIEPVATAVATGVYNTAKAVMETGKKVINKVFSFFGF